MSLGNLPPPAKRIGAPVLTAMLGCLLSACGGSDAEAPKVVPQAPSEQEVSTEAFGIVKAVSVRSIHVDVPAEVAEVHVTAAQLVERGQVLITLDLEEYETLLAARQSALAIERLSLTRQEQTLNGTAPRSAVTIRARATDWRHGKRSSPNWNGSMRKRALRPPPGPIPICSACASTWRACRRMRSRRAKNTSARRAWACWRRIGSSSSA